MKNAIDLLAPTVARPGTDAHCSREEDLATTRFVNRMTPAAVLIALAAAALATSGCARGVETSETDSFGVDTEDLKFVGTGGEDDPAAADSDGGGSGGAGSDADEPPLSELVQQVVAANCVGCHQEFGDLEWVANPLNGVVSPGKPLDSKFYTYVQKDEMPLNSDPLLDQEKGWIYEWIEELDPGVDACSDDRALLGFDELYEAMEDHILDQDPEDRPNIRYLSLIRPYNRGLCADDLESYRAAAVKLVNSLTVEIETIDLSALPTISDDGTISAADLIIPINIDDFGWKDNPGGDLWEQSAAANPYAVEFERLQANTVKAAAETAFPVQPVDSFVFTTSRPPLYYQFTDAPETLDGLIDQLAGVGNELNENLSVRGGVDQSVTELGRGFLRDTVAFGRVLWRAFDFVNDASDVTLDPFNLSPDQTSAIYTLPNGFFGFAVYNSANEREDTMNPAIMADVHVNLAEVTAGVSCMYCHQSGVVDFDDVVFSKYDSGQIFPTPPVELSDQVKEFFDPDLLSTSIANDKQGYANLLASVGLGGFDTDPDPVSEVFHDFDSKVGAEQAAAEFGVDLETFLFKAQAIPELALLETEEDRILRDQLSLVYEEALCLFRPNEVDIVSCNL